MPIRHAKPVTKGAKNAEFEESEDLEEEEEADEDDGEEAGEEADEEEEPEPSRPRKPRKSSARAESRYSEEALEAELVDISAWPGTAEAAKIAGKHPGTIKLWRSQGRIRAQLDGSGCWRHHPDDLVESTPEETTDPAALLATGMTSIVQQGERAGLRLLAMTELSTQGLEKSNEILSEQLQKAYKRIDELEKKLEALFDKTLTSHEANYKHERWLKRMDNEHELAMSDKREAGARVEGLLRILGPIGASIAARVVGNESEAQKEEASGFGLQAPAVGSRKPAASPPAKDGSLQSPVSAPSVIPPVTASVSPPLTASLPIETRISLALGKLASVVRSLDDAQFKGFRLMLPEDVAKALDVIRSDAHDAEKGEALAVVTRTACALSTEQFGALTPIAPQTVAGVLGELRALMDEPA